MSDMVVASLREAIVCVNHAGGRFIPGGFAADVVHTEREAPMDETMVPGEA
jgi:hypothetical protein